MLRSNGDIVSILSIEDDGLGDAALSGSHEDSSCVSGGVYVQHVLPFFPSHMSLGSCCVHQR